MKEGGVDIEGQGESPFRKPAGVFVKFVTCMEMQSGPWAYKFALLNLICWHPPPH